MKTSTPHHSLRGAALITIGLLAASTVFAQGGHVNGPDLSGKSIPAIADGEVPLERLQSAVSTCAKQAASKLLKIILGREIDLVPMQQSFGRPSQIWVDKQRDAEAFSVSGEVSCAPNSQNPKYDCPTENRGLVLQPTDLLPFRIKYPEQTYNYAVNIDLNKYFGNGTGDGGFQVLYRFYEIGYSVEDRQSSGILVANTPSLYAELVDRSVYDEVGNVVEQHKFMKNVRFDAPKDSDFRALPMRNAVTGKPINLTYDFLPYINCVKSRLATP